MDYRLVVFVLTGALASAGAQTRRYFFVGAGLSWTEAQQSCRSNFTDLATLESPADVGAVLKTTTYSGEAWIGLRDDLVASWRWSLSNGSFYGHGESEFRNWNATQPNNREGREYCVVLWSGKPFLGTWRDVNCTVRYPFVCYNGPGNRTATFVKVNLKLSWFDAQTFCRKKYVDLASVRNTTENAAITTLALADTVWIGLRRTKQWSDGSPSLFRHWAHRQPGSGEECATTAFNNSGRWSSNNCSLSLPFICYKTIPPNAANFRLGQTNEKSITLQWDRVDLNVSFILQLGSRRIYVPITSNRNAKMLHTVSSLTPGTEYTFVLFSVLDSVMSSGVNLTAVTVPLNTDRFILAGQTESSISLQWNKVDNHSFILQFNSSAISIPAPDGEGPVDYTVSGLTAGTEYTFTLFTYFNGVLSRGATLRASTEGQRTGYIVKLNVRLQSLGRLSNSDIEKSLEMFLSSHGLSSLVSLVKITSARDSER